MAYELLWSTVTLGGVWRTLVASHERELVPEDLPPPLSVFRSSGNEALAADACARWEAACERHERRTGASVARLSHGGEKGGPGVQGLGWLFVTSQIYGNLRQWFWAGVASSAVGGLLGTVGRFLVLRRILRSVDRGSRAAVLADALLFGLIVLLEGTCAFLARQILAGTVAHALVARANACVSAKAERIARGARCPTINAIYSADIPRVLGLVKFMAMLPQGLAALAGGVGVLVYFLGPNSLVCLACMAATGVAQGYLTRTGHALERPMLAARDARVATIQQAIDAIKAVKFYAWEEQYLDAVALRRARQVALIVAYRGYVILSVNIGKCFPVVAGAATLVTVAAANGGELDASDAFGAIAVFQTLRVGMVILPLALVLVNTFLTTFQRLGEILVAEEDAAVAPLRGGPDALVFDGVVARRDGAPGGGAAPSAERGGEEGARLAAAADTTPPAGFVLDVPALRVARGTVTAVVGGVGSGKTTLVEAALGRVAVSSGSVAADASVGYAPQDPFVASGTVRENVLLGRPYDAAAFDDAVRIASFSRDLAELPRGADTVVGERGTTLSGGQQHRLGVARAVYGDPALLLLDSSLAAVDAAVARDIFENVRAWASRGNGSRAAVLVLSQLHFLPDCDAVVLLEAGAVLHGGDAESLAAGDWAAGTFGAFVAESLRASPPAVAASVDDAAPGAAPRGSARPRPPAAETGGGGAGALVVEEALSRGQLDARVMRLFARAVGHWRIGLIFAGYAASGCVLAASDLILARWTASGSGGARYSIAYGCAAAAYLTVLSSASAFLVLGTARGSEGMHTRTIATVLGAPVQWFASVPSGRILSRFAADFDVVDVDWGNFLDGFLSMAVMFLTLVVMMSAIVPVLIPINALLSYGLLKSTLAINVANRDVKRIANAAVAPTVTNGAEMDRGRVVSRALGCGTFFVGRQRVNMDGMLRGFFQSSSVSQAAYASATAWSSLMAVSAALLVALVPGIVASERRPIALTYALVTPYEAGPEKGDFNVPSNSSV